MKKWGTALGIYQETSTVKRVIAELKKRHFTAFATINHQHDNQIKVDRNIPLALWLIPLFTILAFIALIYLWFNQHIVDSFYPLLIALLSLSGIAVYTFIHRFRIFDKHLIQRFKSRVLIDEIFILVQVDPVDVREVLAILRQVTSGHPVTFFLRPALFEKDSLEIPSETITLELLRQEAGKQALELKHSEKLSKKPNHSILEHIKISSSTLQFLRRDIADAEYIEQTIPSAAEWLLDNMYVLEGSIEDVKRNLPKKYYQELPKLQSGELSGLPRIYALAIELVKNTAGRLNRENMIAFLESYQQQDPLTIGELWAFPLLLRLRLIEWVECLAIRVDNRMREGELASFWGNRLLFAVRHEPQQLQNLLMDLSSSELKTISGHFAEELLDHLFDEQSVIPLVRDWLEKHFEMPIADVLLQEQRHETTEQVIFSNCIRSLITLGQLSWTEIFEEISPVDAILREDPSNIYINMDFATRNQYRSIIETVAESTNFSEVEIARKALQIARGGVEPYERHIGYYLLDEGRSRLEDQVAYSVPLSERFRRWIFRYSKGFYLGGILCGTFVLEGIMLFLMHRAESSLVLMFIFSVLALIPLSEISLQLVNIALSQILPLSLRPKMLYEKGIPKDFKTLIVVPMLLKNEKEIIEELNRLEIRYLANNDPMLLFGLFSDFVDASLQSIETDQALLSTILDGMEALKHKYGPGRFFLFHRQRSWSKSESAWIGQERKRGKLEYLNRFLIGEALPENIVYAGDKDSLKDIRYVITLDADTQLPKDQARALIEVISHPLNIAYLDPSKSYVKRGYTIIQPRVGTDFELAKATRFSQIYSEATVVDPYTQAISNIYQDLFGEGSYHGKGIYDLVPFHSMLTHRFPEEHLLSHDLIEGAFVRVGFASNICLFDSYPETYMSWTLRQHRWIRGDWQILDWIGSRMPSVSGERVSNPLSWYNRWKIFDNLRRSLLPASLVLLLVAGWLFSQYSIAWTALTIGVLVMPCIILCLNHIFTRFWLQTKSLLAELKVLLLRGITNLAVLPYDAFNALDAIVRVGYRRKISKKHLLQWTASEYTNGQRGKAHHRFLFHLGTVSIFSLIILGLVALFNPSTLYYAVPICLLWLFSPLIVYYLDKPVKRREIGPVSFGDQKFLRQVARKTWRYFDEMVGPQTHWLPPDNYQAALNVEVAQRTSPTNIGLWFLSALSAYDFKYITCDELIDRISASVQEMKKLEQYEGHFLNWYDIRNLEPLFPRYVSTVDSGNLLACFWTFKQGLGDMLESAFIPPNALDGIKDSYDVMHEIKKAPKIPGIHQLFNPLLSNNLPLFIKTIRGILKKIQVGVFEGEFEYWMKKIEEQLKNWESIFSRYLNWVEIMEELPEEKLKSVDFKASFWKEQLLTQQLSLENIADPLFINKFDALISASQNENLSKDIHFWGKKLRDAVSQAVWLAGEKLGQVNELVKNLDEMSQKMSMKFLYDSTRKLFSIGYNVDDRRLDSSFYDLLASEARIASLVSIAKGDVPLEHWWALGRVYRNVQRQKVLLSWGGTMFEYLMPLIFNKFYSDSLLGEACQVAVSVQMAYGKKRGIPWGISESAFSGIDSHKIYQYKSFGVPGLGLKRGLEEDLVVSPYSSALALMVEPKAAIENMKNLSEDGSSNMVGPYGYYESIDFTRQHSPTGERGVIIYAYMAHHQGMSLCSINNVLNHQLLSKRFHKDFQICGVDSLLYERIPTSPPIKITGMHKEPVLRRLEPFTQKPILGLVETSQSVTPKIFLLSNEKFSLMVSNTGSGYARWRDLDIYRWRADTTQDAWGSFCYVKDLKSGRLWSTAYQPTQSNGSEYSVNFKGDKAEFRRKDDQIETLTEIVVSPEDDAEIRLVTLINHSPETRYLELTSYAELALAPHLADRAHPCFNKLFIETEAIPELSTLLAFRRLRAEDEMPIWALHTVAVNFSPKDDLQYETNRANFIGRGFSLKRPFAIDHDLTKTTGTVLDPIFSLRRRVIVEPGRRVQLAFITAITDNRAAAVALAEKYQEIAASYRAIEMAWTYAQLELRHLRIHQEEVQLYQKLASRIIYPHAQLRTIEDRIKKNRLGQSGLWSQGISGDNPIVVVAIGDVYDSDLVKQLLIAHAFWCLRGLKVDLIVLNEEDVGYFQPLHEHLNSLVQAYAYRHQIDVPGGVYLRDINKMPTDELNLILSVARVVLIGARGSLRQQLVSPKPKTTYSQKIFINEHVKEEPSPPLPFLELSYFNGVGGYGPDGKSYVIYLDAKKNTPAPWINVLANPQFGTMVSEAGMGCTWFGNSQTNRLTPWSNDPLLDPISDAIYIRDEELGVYWTPTPSPIRELDPYRVTHSQGYTHFEHNSHGIEQELLVFVPVNDAGGHPLRIQRVGLVNRSSRRRRLTLTSYSELVLGGDREETQLHVMTEWDMDSQAIFAYNRYNPDFGSCVAFIFAVGPVLSFTGDRTEFIGRNQSPASPEALSRKRLSGKTGAALDPCAALQIAVEIDPGKDAEVVFIMGYAPDIETARQLIAKCRTDGAITDLFVETRAWWDKTLETIQLEVPDPAVNYAMNRWLLYQSLSCRFWGRSGFYQSSGAYGFRDQLQDSMSLVYAMPKMVREYILKAASRQFLEGDVQHWWHAQTGAGVRTRCSDDLLWLPFVTAFYIRVTGDVSILDEPVSFLESDLLSEGQEEVFQIPKVSTEQASLLEHCRRAVQKGTTAGPRGLPLIGSCDWNDGMSRVGIHGKGESVWMAWFLAHVMNDFADLLKWKSQPESTEKAFRQAAKEVVANAEAEAWDGAWYRRAYFDDGTPIGSKDNIEARIDSIAQSWSVITGLANPERCKMAVSSAYEFLVNAQENLVLLLTPAFDKIPLDPGYIKGYPPGVRENGGQYTHGSSWMAMAYARLGDGNKAAEILKMISPTSHTQSEGMIERYKVEPYVIVADIYNLKNQVGRGGWSWYTGSASWIYRIWLEEVLGFKLLDGNKLTFKCAIPKEWDGFKLQYRYKTATYIITLSNPHHVSTGNIEIKVDGQSLTSQEIPLADDGQTHIVEMRSS